MSVSLTEAAAARVKKYIARDADRAGLRFGVKTTGCSGFAYVVDLTDEIGSNDRVFESHGVKIIVDAENLAYLDGTTIDFRKDGLSESFAFDNPNVSAECGCGESFAVG